MNGITCLTLNQNLDESWSWTAYNKHGQKTLTQDRCDDLPHAIESSLRGISSLSARESEQAPAQPKKAKAKAPLRRSARK